MSYNPLMQMAIRPFNGASGLSFVANQSLTNREMVPNAWQQFTTTIASAPATTTTVHPSAGVIKTSIAFTTSDLFWLDDCSLLVAGVEQFAGGSANLATNEAASFPEWGNNSGATVTLADTGQFHSGSHSTKFHPASGANFSVAPFASSGVLFTPAVSPGQAVTLSFWLYWNGFSYKAPKRGAMI